MRDCRSGGWYCGVIMRAREIVEEELAYKTVAKEKTVLTKRAREVYDVITASSNEECQGEGVVKEMRVRVVHPGSWGRFQLC